MLHGGVGVWEGVQAEAGPVLLHTHVLACAIVGRAEHTGSRLCVACCALVGA